VRGPAERASRLSGAKGQAQQQVLLEPKDYDLYRGVHLKNSRLVLGSLYEMETRAPPRVAGMLHRLVTVGVQPIVSVVRMPRLARKSSSAWLISLVNESARQPLDAGARIPRFALHAGYRNNAFASSPRKRSVRG
jgi:hypothetical protein